MVFRSTGLEADRTNKVGQQLDRPDSSSACDRSLHHFALVEHTHYAQADHGVQMAVDNRDALAVGAMNAVGCADQWW